MERAIRTYRLHYLAVFFGVGLVTLQGYQLLNVAGVGYLLMISSVFWASHLYNKCFDQIEDRVTRPSELHFDPRVLRAATAALVVWPLMPLSLGAVPLWPYFCLLPYIVLYSQPLWRGVRIKNILLFKNVVPATFWGGSMVVLLYYAHDAEWSADFIHTFLITWLIVCALNIIFDIRDQAGDTHAGVRTIANTCGTLCAKVVILALLSGSAWYAYALGVMTVPLLVILTTVALAAVIARNATAPWFYDVLLYTLIALLFGSLVL